MSDPTSPTDRHDGLQRNRPSVTAALDKKARDTALQSEISELPPGVRHALAEMDRKRVARGQMPLNDEETAKAATSAATRHAATPAADDSGIASLPTNAVRDVAQIVKSLPHLPGALVGEVKDVADGFADDHDEAQAENLNPIAEFLSMPGVRLIPGAYVAKNAAQSATTGNVDEFVENPLLNVLDVLPIASKAARGLPVVKAAEEAAELTRAAGGTVKPVRPLKVAATKTLTQAGEVVPNRVGQVIDRAMETKPLAAISDTFGAKARATMQRLGIEEQEMQARGAHPAPTDAIGQIYAEWAPMMADDAALAERYGGLTRAREQEITSIASRQPEFRVTFTPDEHRYVADAGRVQEQLAEHIAATGELVKIGGEWFDKAAGRRLQKVAQRAADKAAAVTGTGQAIPTRVGGVRGSRIDNGIMDDIDALAAADERWVSVRDLIDAGDMRGAAKTVNQLKNYGSKAAGLNDQRMVTVRRVLTEAQQARRTFDAVRERTPPARFDELITRRAGDAYLESLAARSSISNVEEARRFIDQGTLDQIPGFDRREWEKVHRSQRKTWETLRDAGQDPVFVGRVTPERASTIGRPRIDGAMPSLQTARARVSDVSPSTNSIAVSVTNQAWDIIRRDSTEAAIESIRSEFGIPEQQLLDQFTPAAERLAAINPRYDVVSARNTLIRRQYRPLDTGTLSPSSAVASGTAAERVWVPRQVATTLQQVQSRGMSQLRALNDPITRTWRISLLALSPRWHLFNVIGGAAMMSSEVGPQAFRQLGKAREIISAAREGAELPAPIAREVHRAIGAVGREEASLALRQGASIRRWFDESQAAKAGRGVIQKSFDINSYVDDMYRVMTYLEGESQATKRLTAAGASSEVARTLAQQDGVALTRKVLQDVSSLTPFERGVLRPIFPFYSWLSHVMRFAFSYPYDHPWRTALVAGGSRIVMEDLGDAGSLDMLEMISWGEPDEKGERASLRVSGMNPFNDTAKLFTLSGWLGNTNPLFATAAEALGFDAQQGGIDLYPSMVYSEQTGGLTVDTGHPIRNLVLSSVPHLGALVRAVGQDPDYEKLRALDPEAADRQLWGGLGVPTVYRRYSAEQKLISNELERERAARNTISDALKSGDLDKLAPWFTPEQIDGLKTARNSGQLDQYIAPEAER